MFCGVDAHMLVIAPKKLLLYRSKELYLIDEDSKRGSSLKFLKE